MSKKETENLPVVRETVVPALQTNRPEFLPQAARGLENVERADVVLPRLGVCQSMSPQRKPSSPNFIEGLREGQLFNSLTGEVYQEFLRFVPILIFKSRLYFRPMKDGGGLLCQSPNGKTGGQLNPSCDACPHSQWTNNALPDREGTASLSPDCTLLYNYAGIMLPAREMIVVSLKTTGVKVAKQWNAMMRLRNADSFAGVYELRTASQKNSLGEWATLTVKPAGWVDEETFAFCEKAYASLRDVDVKVHEEGLAEEREPGSDDVSY